jgi:formyltetrahydrofolate deformylase
MSHRHHYTLTLSCPDQVGIVAGVSGFIADHQGWILEAQHHSDQEAGQFFMRQEILAESLPFGIAEFRQRFQSIADKFEMNWQVSDSAIKKRVVILVSKLEHCLHDLLSRWQSGELAVDIPCVISNHQVFRQFVEWHGIPFHYIPVTTETKQADFSQLVQVFEQAQADTMVLARYMQILTPDICQSYSGRIINIHHSFLPSFVGAKPYHQAYVRGVKLIGATCHYVTSELDAGPIIEQDVVRIDHSRSADQLVRDGKDIEKAVLARGLRYHVEDRVIVHGNKTVVFK